MGAYSPTPFLDARELERVRREVIDPWLRGCREEGIDYRGILYPGLMLTATGPRVLEFNARFGDPETEVYLPRMENDLLEVLEASIDGRLDQIELRWSPLDCVGVVIASEGYPGAYPRGRTITGLDEAGRIPNVKVFHAGTRAEGDQIDTNGGRVLVVTAWARGLEAARATAYEAVNQIKFDGAQFRRDIAAKALS
jgi:phosphoribosylamine--glycine ligase